MSVLIIAESHNGSLKKVAQEAISYGAHIAQKINGKATVLVIGQGGDDLKKIAGNFGASTVLLANNDSLHHFDPQFYTNLIDAAAKKVQASVIIFSHDKVGKAVAPRLSARLKAGLVSGVVDFPKIDGNFTVKRNVFSGKAFAEYAINTPIKILSLLPNSVPFVAGTEEATLENFSGGIEGYQSPLKIEVNITENTDEINLTDAELVVSAGRGLKGPENWGIVEELAKVLGAATACSRPVSDIGWRPHHEHVGQTGIAIRPNLYIAIGISGAIQHLAGVNGSKVIVVINKDPEAPFFKAADYGIVGDAFEILPKLTEAIKNFKLQNA